jgi:hypothetical protein
MFVLDPKTLELCLQPALSQVQVTDEQILYALAHALLNQIPVYPNRPADEPTLVEWHERLVREGFKTTVDGKNLHFLITPKITTAPRGRDALLALTSTRLITPAEAALVRSELARRLTELSAAQSVLDLLDSAIRELREVLTADSRNEHALQDCITAHPILFGPEYKRVIAKHRLGDDLEMDYALERLTGFVDLVEIESSTLELYTKTGDPRKELVHAEQQVMDWLEWLQAHGDYARHKLSGIHRPRAFVVIGRRNCLTAMTSKKLEQRNRLLSDVLEILTYDDLLDRAIHLRSLLTGVRENTALNGVVAAPPNSVLQLTKPSLRSGFRS